MESTLNIVFLDADTLGQDVSLNYIKQMGNFQAFTHTLPEHTVQRCINADVIITNKVVLNREILKHLPRLKLICVAATGTNNIDLEYCSTHTIAVKNAVNYSSNSVAQHTFTSLFALIGNIAWHDDYVKSGEYSKSLHFTNLAKPYFELSGKTFGIIGLGNIGRKVAEIASVFGAKVLYASISGNERIEKYELVTLQKLLQSSDIVSIHSPLTDKTKNLIAETELNLMKPNSILINMGRGGIVNETDLALALSGNLISGACIDVFEKEPIAGNNPLLNPKIAHKLLLTPHVAWASKEARETLIGIIATHIKQFS
jgi:lactate dehydrogenase-like 2-hydroxyacid dehydrogenase